MRNTTKICTSVRPAALFSSQSNLSLAKVATRTTSKPDLLAVFWRLVGLLAVFSFDYGCDGGFRLLSGDFGLNRLCFHFWRFCFDLMTQTQRRRVVAGYVFVTNEICLCLAYLCRRWVLFDGSSDIWLVLAFLTKPA